MLIWPLIIAAFLDEQLFREGADVAKGASLFRLERPPFEADVDGGIGYCLRQRFASHGGRCDARLAARAFEVNLMHSSVSADFSRLVHRLFAQGENSWID